MHSVNSFPSSLLPCSRSLFLIVPHTHLRTSHSWLARVAMGFGDMNVKLLMLDDPVQVRPNPITVITSCEPGTYHCAQQPVVYNQGHALCTHAHARSRTNPCTRTLHRFCTRTPIVQATTKLRVCQKFNLLFDLLFSSSCALEKQSVLSVFSLSLIEQTYAPRL